MSEPSEVKKERKSSEDTPSPRLVMAPTPPPLLAAPAPTPPPPTLQHNLPPPPKLLPAPKAPPPPPPPQKKKDPPLPIRRMTGASPFSKSPPLGGPKTSPVRKKFSPLTSPPIARKTIAAPAQRPSATGPGLSSPPTLAAQVTPPTTKAASPQKPTVITTPPVLSKPKEPKPSSSKDEKSGPTKLKLKLPFSKEGSSPGMALSRQEKQHRKRIIAGPNVAITNEPITPASTFASTSTSGAKDSANRNGGPQFGHSEPSPAAPISCGPPQSQMQPNSIIVNQSGQVIGNGGGMMAQVLHTNIGPMIMMPNGQMVPISVVSGPPMSNGAPVNNGPPILPAPPPRPNGVPGRYPPLAPAPTPQERSGLVNGNGVHTPGGGAHALKNAVFSVASAAPPAALNNNNSANPNNNLQPIRLPQPGYIMNENGGGMMSGGPCGFIRLPNGQCVLVNTPPQQWMNGGQPRMMIAGGQPMWVSSQPPQSQPMLIAQPPSSAAPDDAPPLANGSSSTGHGDGVAVVQSLPSSLSIPQTAGNPNRGPRPAAAADALPPPLKEEEDEKKDLSDMPTLILGESAVGPTDVDIRKLFLKEVESQAGSGNGMGIGSGGVLTHVIDGFLIQESTEPFPVSPFPYHDLPACLPRSSTPPRLQAEVGDGEPSVEGEPGKTKSPRGRLSSPKAPPLSPSTDQSLLDDQVCRGCGVAKAEAGKRFCSVNCKDSKKHKKKKRHRSRTSEGDTSPANTSNRSRQSTESSPSTSSGAPSIPPIQISRREGGQCQLVSPTARAALTSPSATIPSAQPSPATPTTPLPSTPDLVRWTSWTMEEVFSWILSIGVGREIAERFLQEEIDGGALTLLTSDMLRSAPFEMKIGPFLKITKGLDSLKNQ